MPILVCCEGFLEEKPNRALLTLNSLSDLRALLDNDIQYFNMEPAIPEVASADFDLQPQAIPSLQIFERNAYLWEPNVFEGRSSVEWNNLYRQILFTNTVLEELEKFDPTIKNSQEGISLKGSALFYRSYAFYNLATVFAMPYLPGSNDNDPGIVLRLSPDVKLKVQRATLKETYDRILEDLKTSIPLLETRFEKPTRPSRQAALALIARIYLALQDYENALDYAQQALSIHDIVLDFNLLSPALANPIPQLNQEIIFQSNLQLGLYTLSQLLVPRSDLIDSYDTNDLRRNIFYTTRPSGLVNFRGHYSGNIRAFGGLTTGETILIKAESLARLNRLEEAKAAVFELLQFRFPVGYDFQSGIQTDNVLDKILEERRKELVFRGLRWQDLRRFNFSSDEKVTLSRTIGGNILTLPPLDPRYAFPIPDNEIELSGLVQNPRN